MRVKPVPQPPADPDTVAIAQQAIPLVPAPEADCCARLLDRLSLEARDEARTWLTFLHGLDLVTRQRHGFARARRELDQPELARAVLDGVFGARELLAILDAAHKPLDHAAIFQEFEPHIPQWERHHAPAAWQDRWQERAAYLLEWLVLVDRVDSTPDGYLVQ